MKIYSSHAVNEFIVCCGYKGYIIKEYFANYFLHMSDVTFDMCKNERHIHHNGAEPWRITLVDTGDHTNTGGRLLRVRDYVAIDEAFCFTYGDGVSDVNITSLIAFHQRHGRLATVTAVEPAGRYGALAMAGSRVTGFVEKPKGEAGWINGGFFVLSPRVIDYINGDGTSWEADTLAHMAAKGELEAYPHHGFWQPMDTLREKNMLEELWHSGKAPWKTWT
jgi:glucose-1-phosphate cytidylyltransferase